MTQKQKVLSAICEMNINTLRELLPGDRTYMDVDKELFLTSLSEAFFMFRKEGDNKLMLQSGKCRTNCCSEELCGGYKLVGNRTSNFLHLIFLGSEENITDIFVCNDFEGPDSDHSKIDFAWEYEEDQKVEYQPTVDCIIMEDKIAAVMDTICGGTGFLTLAALESWCLSCENVATTILDEGNQYSFQQDFVEVYNNATHVIKIWRCLGPMHDIQQEFVELDMNNEIEVLRFLVKNEETFKQVPLWFEKEVKQDKWNRSYYLLSDKLELKVDTNPLCGIMEFRSAVESVYSEKYDFYVDSERLENVNSSENLEKLTLDQVLTAEGVFLENISLPAFKGIRKESADREGMETIVNTAIELFIKMAITNSTYFFWDYIGQKAGILTLKHCNEFRDEIIEVDYSQIPYNEENEVGELVVTLYDNAENRNLLEQRVFSSPLTRQADWLMGSIASKISFIDWEVRFAGHEDLEDLPF